MKDRSRSVYDFGLLIVIVLAVALATVTVHSRNVALQQNQAAAQASPSPSPTPTPTPINWSTDPTLKRFVFRSIGPASMGGRIDDFAVPEQNPYIIYVAFATNGVWKSTNNGTTFTPIFDTYSTHSIGDIAVAPSDPNTVWVGTGEPNNRQSSSYGDGIYKSVFVDELDVGPRLTAVGCFVNSALLVWSKQVTEHGNVDGVRIFRIDDDATDGLRVFESHLCKRLAGVD